MLKSVLPAHGNDGSGEPAAVALRQPLGRVVVSLPVPVQVRGGEGQVVQVGREAPACAGAGSAQARNRAPRIPRSRARCRTREGSRERGAVVGRPHAAQPLGDPRLDALRVRVVVPVVGRASALRGYPDPSAMSQWMPGTRRAAAESASGSSTWWAKTRHRGSGACRPRRSTGRSSSGSSGTRRPPFSPDGPRHSGPAAPGARPAGGGSWRGSSAGGPYDAPRIRRIGELQVYGQPPADAVGAILRGGFRRCRPESPDRAGISRQ